MKPQAFLLLIIVMLVFWPTSTPNILPSVDNYQLMAAEGLTAVTLFSVPESEKKEVVACKCENGKIMSPDGITPITCECGVNCKCEKVQKKVCPKCGQENCNSLKGNVLTSLGPEINYNPNLTQQILFFTSKTCPPCLRWKNEEQPKMEAMKYIVSKDEKAHVLIVDTDENPNLASQFRIGSIPTFVKVERGRETIRLGYSSAEYLARLWKN